MSSEFDLWERLSLPWKIVGGVLMVAGVLALVFGSEWLNIANSHASPHRFDDVFKAPRSDDSEAVVAITSVRVDASAEAAAFWTQWFVIVTDASSGDVLVEHPWPEKHDRPTCHAGAPGRIVCVSNETGLATYDLETMAVVDEPPLGESKPPQPSACVSHTGEIKGVRFSFQSVAQTQAKSLHVQPLAPEAETCPSGLIEPEILCDTENNFPLELADEAVAIVADQGSLIRDRKKLTVMAVDDACTVRWRHERPTGGRSSYQTRIQDVLVLAVTPDQLTEESRAALIGLDASTGTERWRHEI